MLPSLNKKPLNKYPTPAQGSGSTQQLQAMPQWDQGQRQQTDVLQVTGHAWMMSITEGQLGLGSGVLQPRARRIRFGLSLGQAIWAQRHLQPQVTDRGQVTFLSTTHTDPTASLAAPTFQENKFLDTDLHTREDRAH